MGLVKNVLLGFVGWLILIFCFGYTLGVEDQQEILPYVKFLNDPSLYKYDFFIQNLSKTIPNERFIFAYLLMPFLNHLEYYLLLFHCITTIVLLIGMQKVANLFITNSLWSWVCAISSISIFYLFTIGGCDLYYNTFEGSNVAKAIGIWAIYFFLKEKNYISIVLLVISTYFQIIVGLDLAIVLCIILLIQKKYKDLFACAAIYGIGAGIYLGMILIARSGNHSIDSSEYFNIMFLFRHPHHFIFSTFPLKNILFVGIMFLIGGYYYYSRNKKLALFFLIVFISTVFYAIAVDVFHHVGIGNFNGYKNIIWIKFFGVVALFYFLEKSVMKWTKWIKISPINEVLIFGIIGIALFNGLIQNDYLNYRNLPIHIGNRIVKDELIDISIQAKMKLPKDALFIVPFHATAFKYWSERSSYVDFKANVRSPEAAGDWYDRVKSVYGISLEDKSKGFELRQKAEMFYSEHYFCSLDRFKRKQVQYFLCSKNHKKIDQYEPPILENAGYKIYQIR